MNNTLSPEMQKYYNDNIAKPMDFGERTLQWRGLLESPMEGEEVIASVLCNDDAVRSMPAKYKDGLFWVSDKRAKEIRYWAGLPEPAYMVRPKLEHFLIDNDEEPEEEGCYETTD